MSTYPRATFGDFATEVVRPLILETGIKYRSVGVKWYGEGVHVHETREGHEFDAARFEIRADDLVYNDMWARKGSVAIVPLELSGAVASSHFPTFSLNRELIEPRYLYWFFRTPTFWEECEAASRGSTGRNQIKRRTFLTISIPLPPVMEQRRVVARIEELAGQIEEARKLRREAVAEVEALLASAIRHCCTGKDSCGSDSGESATELLERISRKAWPGQVQARERRPTILPAPPEVPSSWLVMEAGELQEKGAILDIQDGNHGGDYPRKAEFADEGVPFVTAKQFHKGRIRIEQAPRLPQNRAAKLRIGFAKAGDVLLTHNASVGDVAIAPDDAGDFLLGTSATYWRCNPEVLHARYLFYFMRSELFQDQLRFIMKQTTPNQVSVLKQVNLWICVPPLSEQSRIVAELDALEKEVDALKRLQAETQAELDSLLPSILDRAFKGEL